MGQSTDQQMNPRVRMLRIIANCNFVIDFAMTFHEMEPEARPMDCEEERIVRAAASRCLDLFDQRRWDAFDEAYDELLAATRSWDLTAESGKF